MSAHRHDLAITLSAVAVAIVCAVALSLGLAMGLGMRGAGIMGPGIMGSGRSAAVPSCAAPALPGTVVNVTLADMHGAMGSGGGMMGPGMGMAGMMRIIISPATVPPGQVSFRVINAGVLSHELVVMPLANGQRPGQRAIGPDDKVDEAGSLGEASRTCGADRGDDDPNNIGIAAGASGWTTVTLAPGRFELICNITGHYRTGMYAELDVSPPR